MKSDLWEKPQSSATLLTPLMWTLAYRYDSIFCLLMDDIKYYISR